ncbi:hypothetical protein IT408_03825 [Candidatus Uhrbacteria bacterium]|nr:hypothetical protein [Candidatus Uhrbacteria bacterium]
MPRSSFNSFSDMPVGLRRFLFSKEFSEADLELAKKYQIPSDKIEHIGDTIMDIIFNDISLKNGIDEIKKIVYPDIVTELTWKDFISDVIRLEFWPIRDLFANELSFWLSEQQIGTGGWSMERVLLKPLTYSSAATELAQKAGFSIMGAQLRERLRDLIVSKIKGVRVDAQIREALMRSQDYGGIGLDANQANATIGALNDLLQTVDIMSESDYSDWLNKEAQKEQTISETETQQVDHVQDTDDPEITAIKQKLKSQSLVPPTVLEKTVQDVLSKIVDKPSDEYLLRRMNHAISSRLRDVRNSLELRQILLRDSKVGGVGMTVDQANEAIEVVEASYRESHTSIMNDEKKKLEEQMVIQRQKIEERKIREKEEHAKWYEEKVLAKKQEEERKTKATELFKKQFETGLSKSVVQSNAPTSAVDIKEQHLEHKRFGPMVPAVAAGAAQFVAQAAAVEVAARPEVKVSTATAPMKPRMDGVIPPPVSNIGVNNSGPRLIGLVGELAELSLVEFRRMAKTPEEAVQKILQKIETLGQETFERRIEGIKAFQSSPLQGSYMSLVAESFKTGKQVASLADEKRAKGENTLSSSEISAILTLNSKLHF